MNMQNTDTSNTPDTPRPIGFWITAVDRLLAAEFATAFEREGASRRDWRLLNVIDGTAPAHRPLRPHKLHHLLERGWIARDGEGWKLTKEGRAAKERLGVIADGIRATITDAVSPEEYDTTVATLEKIATALGWEDGTPLPRRGHGPHRHDRRGFLGRGLPGWAGTDRILRHLGHGGGHRDGGGHGQGHGHESGGYGNGHAGHGHTGHEHTGHEHGHTGHEHGHDRANEHSGHQRREHAGHERFGHGHHDRAGRIAQHAYERGFDAGFSRGRAS
jgi:hypothetical protein